MWGSLYKIQKLLQKLRPLYIHYANELFYQNLITGKLLRLKLNLIDFNLLVVSVACVVGLNKILAGDKGKQETKTLAQIKQETQRMVLGSVFFTLFLILHWICLVVSWTFRHRSTQAIVMVNQARHMDQKRNRYPDHYPVRPSKMEIRIFGAVLYNFVAACFGGLIAVIILPLMSKSNPGYVMIAWLVPDDFLSNRSFFHRVLASVYIGIGGYFGVIPVIQAFTFITAALYELRYILKQGYYKIDKGMNSLTCFGFHSQLRPPQVQSFHRPWMIYAEDIIFVTVINQFGRVFYPATMLTAFVINVVTSTVCIKFHHELQGIVMALFLGFDVVVFFATWAVHNFAVIVKEESDHFRECWKKNLFSKLQRSQLRACIPLEIQIGAFFPLQRSTALNTVMEVVNALMTLLLMDE